MDGMYGIPSAGNDYPDKAFISPDNLMNIVSGFYHDNDPSIPSANHHRRFDPASDAEDYRFFQCSAVSESVNSVYAHRAISLSRREDDEANYGAIKAKIAAHPGYPKLLDAYIDCQKVGAPPEMAYLLDEIRRERDVQYCKPNDAVSTCLGIDPELDDFMERYCDVLVKYKRDLSRPLDEATSFLSNAQTQLAKLCGDESSEEDCSGGEAEIPDPHTKIEDRELKERLLRRYGNHINSLKLEFSKKKKKGKLPKEARQMLLEWWGVHYKWPYPTEADKISLAETTGLDQKQINNWFINQRKRHWKPSENMHSVMDSLSGNFFMEETDT